MSACVSRVQWDFCRDGADRLGTETEWWAVSPTERVSESDSVADADLYVVQSKAAAIVGEGEMRGIQLVAVFNLIARCHWILHAGNVMADKNI